MKPLIQMTLLVAVSLSALWACSQATETGTAPAPAPTVEVSINNLHFQPALVMISPGTHVVWKNLDAVDHDVTSGKSMTGRKARGLKQTKFPDGKFASGLFGQGKTFSVTFDHPGDFDYYCNVHPFMTGKIVVAAVTKG